MLLCSPGAFPHRAPPGCPHLLGFAEAHPHLQPAHEQLDHLVVLRLEGGPVELEAHLAVAVEQHHRQQPQHDPRLQHDVAAAEEAAEPRSLGQAGPEAGAAPQKGQQQQEAAAHAAEGLGGGGEELRRDRDVMRREQQQRLPLSLNTPPKGSLRGGPQMGWDRDSPWAKVRVAGWPQGIQGLCSWHARGREKGQQDHQQPLSEGRGQGWLPGSRAGRRPGGGGQRPPLQPSAP